MKASPVLSDEAFYEPRSQERPLRSQIRPPSGGNAACQAMHTLLAAVYADEVNARRAQLVKRLRRRTRATRPRYVVLNHGGRRSGRPRARRTRSASRAGPDDPGEPAPARPAVYTYAVLTAEERGA